MAFENDQYGATDDGKGKVVKGMDKVEGEVQCVSKLMGMDKVKGMYIMGNNMDDGSSNSSTDTAVAAAVLVAPMKMKTEVNEGAH